MQTDASFNILQVLAGTALGRKSMPGKDFFTRMQGEARRANWAARANSVPGFLSLDEGYALLALAEQWPAEGDIVEVGSFKGRSTSFLALGCASSGRGKVYAVDHFRGSAEHQKGGHEETAEIVDGGSTFATFSENIARLDLAAHVKVKRGDSKSVSKRWKKPIRLLFIDGDHSYQGTKGDFNAWSPFLAKTGLACFHDYENGWYVDGVTRFINETLLPSPHYVLKARLSSLMVFMKK